MSHITGSNITGGPADRKVHAGDPYGLASESAETLQSAIHHKPVLGIVLGTGLGGLADHLDDRHAIPYAKIRHFPQTSVQGHAGQLVVGELAGVPVAVLQGRSHLYEGYSAVEVVHPVRVLGVLGIRALIVTNAAGGLDPSFTAGDLMLIRDHIGLPIMAGHSPLAGINDERFGPRFPSMTDTYDAALLEHARTAARELGIPTREGVYIMAAGPSYETPAELVFLRRIGGDAVGMSTVPEAIAARHMGIRVLGISCVTNVAYPGDAAAVPAPNHQEVIDAANRATANLNTLITGMVARLRQHEAQLFTATQTTT
ncbi:MAG TPA: purine-nucleoside phosphorylase [Ktedonobacterales bacterium]|jgi:purine-nucleoside phosphorylase